MRALASRILVALLVLSQTWTGALRGLEFCIPVGICEDCGRWLISAHDHERDRDHALADALPHRHGPEIAREHSHQYSHRHEDGAAHGDSGCACHIHVETADDASHRGTPPGAGLVLVSIAIGLIEPWIPAASLPEPTRCIADPPDEAWQPLFEQRVIEATVLQV